jgi:hypothetical protein
MIGAEPPLALHDMGLATIIGMSDMDFFMQNSQFP